MSGWIKLHREIQHHWIFQRDDYFKARILLLCKANHQDYKTLANEKIAEVVLVRRGEVVSSLKKLGLELMWSSSKVKRFLKKLEKDNMIVLKNEKRWTHLSINNYDTYQYVRHEAEAVAEAEQIPCENNQIKKKKDKKVKNLSQKEQLQGIKQNLVRYQKDFPHANVKLEFDRMADWLESSGKRYKNYNAFFRNWLRKASEGNEVEEQKVYTYKCDCSDESFTSEFKDLYKLCSCGEQMKPTI